jgi:hypothetical protein
VAKLETNLFDLSFVNFEVRRYKFVGRRKIELRQQVRAISLSRES